MLILQVDRYSIWKNGKIVKENAAVMHFACNEKS